MRAMGSSREISVEAACLNRRLHGGCIFVKMGLVRWAFDGASVGKIGGTMHVS
jgi:hypothetical protein